ncbi:MAG: hypothetical protein LBS58_04445 [Coriobacteriales bacterium]|jgi:hypothetical protein|nr:hypothetical protein [Coriobacteriales bacterium]
MIFRESDAFSKDVKALMKKWRTLPGDIEEAKKVVASLYEEQEGVDSALFRKNFFDGKAAAILTDAEQYEVVKMRLDCKSPGSKGKARLVFVFVVSDEEVTLLELFSKSNKDREDQRRIDGFINLLAC